MYSLRKFKPIMRADIKENTLKLRRDLRNEETNRSRDRSQSYFMTVVDERSPSNREL